MIKQKAFIIKSYDKTHNDYNAIKEYYEQGKSLYLSSIHQLMQNISFTKYVNQPARKYDYMSHTLIDEIRRLALTDYEMNKIKKMSNNSSLHIQIYNSDVEFYKDKFTITMLNLTIDFNFIYNLQLINSFKIKQVQDKFILEIECVIDLTGLQLASIYQKNDKYIIINQDFEKCESINNQMLIIGLKNNFNERFFDSQTIYIENIINFTDYNNMINEANLREKHLDYAENIASQIIRLYQFERRLLE